MRVLNLNVESTDKISFIENVIDTIGRFQTFWGLIAVVFALLGFVFAFRYKINKASKFQIEKFEKDKKYLPSIYIELHREMEALRYFIFAHRWKHRVIKQYNHLFEGYEGTRIKEILPSNIQFRLSPFCSFSKIDNVLRHMYVNLENFRKNEEKYYQKFGQVVWAIRNSTYHYIDVIRSLKDLMAMMSEKNIILVGSAGNGKTNLLCRISEIIIANKMPCMLINARDIKEDSTSYVMNKLPLSQTLASSMGKYLLHLVSIILFLQRKHFYILVDAINENDREVFTDSVGKLLDAFASYKRIRILFTCRSEYFDSRYKMLFSSADAQPYIFQLSEAHYDERAMQKLIQAYSNHYNVCGPFSLEMRKKLMNSLLLTRLFFEVNSNRNEHMLEFRNAEIYKQYFERVAAENSNIDLIGIVNKIAELMFTRFSFDGISMEELHLSTDDLNTFRKLLDNNLIISHSVHEGTGITEREEEYVYFVFDELRDFCLARYLLMFDEHNQDNKYTAFFTQTNLLFKQRLSSIEGIIKYAYHHFREKGLYGLCAKLLSDFGESDVQEILDWKNPWHRKSRRFNCFGFSLIFSEGDNIVFFELEYIVHCIEKTCKYYWDMCWYLLANELSGCKPNISLAVKILTYWENVETPHKILEHFFTDEFSRYFSYHNEPRRVDILVDWVTHIEAKNGQLSESLKELLIILAAYDPVEFTLRNKSEAKRS